MKLLLVPARQGAQWMRLGVKTFFRQPLAFTGLFFLFVTLISFVGIVPIIGNVLGLTLVPLMTLGFMAASQDAVKGTFPMPRLLFLGLRGGPVKTKQILLLGVFYSASVLLAMGISSLVDGGSFARLYLFGGPLNPETILGEDFQLAALVSLCFYVPISLLFWHAPALVFWHGLSPIKAMFFSFIACKRNFGAFMVYSLLWMLGSIGLGLLVAVLASSLGGDAAAGIAIFPAIMIAAAAFFSSIYFTFEACFDTAEVHLA